MADMFGSPMGELAFDENARAELLSTLRAQESLGRIAMQPIERRTKEVALEGAELDLKSEKEFARLLSEGPGAGMEAAAAGKPITLDVKLDGLAQRAAQAGLVKKAGDLAKVAADIRSKNSTAANQEVQRRKAELQTVRESTELLGQLLGGVKDQSTWEAANDLWQMQTGQQSPFAGMPYSPELVTQLNEASLSAKERATLAFTKAQQEATAEYRRAQLAGTKASREIATERLQLERDRQKRLEKNDGNRGNVRTPNKTELEAVKSKLKQAGIETAEMDINSVKLVQLSVASRAKELQNQNPALGYEQALERAYEEAENNGELEIEKTGQRNIPLIGEVGGTQRFKAKEKAKPIGNLPPQARSQLSEGNLTTFKNGQVWTIRGGKPERIK